MSTTVETLILAPSTSTPALTNSSSLSYPISRPTSPSDNSRHCSQTSSSGISSRIQSPSAVTTLPSEEIESFPLTEEERNEFNLIYFIDSEALLPFGILDWGKDEEGQYVWKTRTKENSLPSVQYRPSLTGADVTIRVQLTKLINIYVHVPMHSWEFATCDTRSVRAALQKGYFSLIQGDPRSIIVRPSMYPIPAAERVDQVTENSVCQSQSLPESRSSSLATQSIVMEEEITRSKGFEDCTRPVLQLSDAKQILTPISRESPPSPKDTSCPVVPVPFEELPEALHFIPIHYFESSLDSERGSRVPETPLYLLPKKKQPCFDHGPIPESRELLDILRASVDAGVPSTHTENGNAILLGPRSYSSREPTRMFEPRYTHTNYSSSPTPSIAFSLIDRDALSTSISSLVETFFNWFSIFVEILIFWLSIGIEWKDRAVDIVNEWETYHWMAAKLSSTRRTNLLLEKNSLSQFTFVSAYERAKELLKASLPRWVWPLILRYVWITTAYCIFLVVRSALKSVISSTLCVHR